jgi:hypothetical protein
MCDGCGVISGKPDVEDLTQVTRQPCVDTVEHATYPSSGLSDADWASGGRAGGM